MQKRLSIGNALNVKNHITEGIKTKTKTPYENSTHETGDADFCWERELPIFESGSCKEIKVISKSAFRSLERSRLIKLFTQQTNLRQQLQLYRKIDYPWPIPATLKLREGLKRLVYFSP